MASSSSIVVLLFSLFAISFLQVTAQTLCVPANGGNASSVLGKADFTNNTAGGTGLNELSSPNQFVIDPVTQKVFVSDAGNARILRYTSSQALVIGGAAELVLFGNSTAQCGNNTLDFPEQIDYYNNYLFVSDANNARVLKLNGVTSANTTIQSPGTVFGQLNDSVCSGSGLTLNDLPYPTGVAVTNNGSLFVSDGANTAIVNCFIKRFDGAGNTTNYPAPNSLLGDGVCGPVSNSSVSPYLYYLSVDKVNGHLFAADYNYRRVILFKSAHLKPNASGAIDTFFGQATNIAQNNTCSDINLEAPVGVFFDSAKSVLIVADQNQNRIAFYDSPLAASTGQPINNVLGVANTSVCNNAGGNTQSTFSNLAGVTYDISFPGVFLLAADNGNHRGLRFECTNATFSMSITMSNTSAASSPGTSTGIPSSSGLPPSSSGVAPSSVVVASSSGVAPSSVVVPSSSGVAPSSVVVASSSGVVVPSQSDTASAAALSLTGSGTPSQSRTPSNTFPPQSDSNTPIIPPPAGSSAGLAVCGNGVVERAEECDAGAAVPRTKCCTAFCTTLPAGSPCGRATSKCTKRPKCRNSLASRTPVCQPGQPKKVGTKCGKGGIFSRKTCKADGSCSK
jgi:hypothetical protein